jgi:hypothetical protein
MNDVGMLFTVDAGKFLIPFDETDKNTSEPAVVKSLVVAPP